MLGLLFTGRSFIYLGMIEFELKHFMLAKHRGVGGTQCSPYGATWMCKRVLKKRCGLQNIHMRKVLFHLVLYKHIRYAMRFGGDVSVP